MKKTREAWRVRGAVFSALTALAVSACLKVTDTEDGDGPDDAVGGSNATSGTGGSAIGGQAVENVGGTNVGGTNVGGGTTAGGGAGGEAGANSANCEELPARYDTDLTVGPGCVRMSRTTGFADAVLTILPGTTVRVAADGFLRAGRENGSSVVAIGTEAEPIVFTSDQPNPLPGDWQCIYIGSGGSEIRHAVFEYGGSPCAATGAGEEAMLQVHAAMRGFTDSLVRKSSSHGVLMGTGAPRQFQNNTFSENGDASISVRAALVTSLGKPNTFDDADDFIRLEAELMTTGGTWPNQGVPYRASGSFGITSNIDLTIEAGVRVEMPSGSIQSTANVSILGTAAEPVIFTSSAPNPTAGSWGCLVFNALRMDHAIIEFGGSGAGCTGAGYQTGLYAPGSALITNTVLRHIAGSAIRSNSCPDDTTAWCENTFEALGAEPLDCSNTPVACQ